MFSALGDLVGGVVEDDEEREEGGEPGIEDKGPSQEKADEGSSSTARSFWSMASALRETVKQRTAELAASIQETDWKKELNAFQQGLKEDSEELQQKTKEAVEHLPAVVEQLKSEHTGAVLQAKAKEAQHQLQLAGKSLGTFGHKLVLGTSELFDQIKDAIQSEMAFDNPQGSRVASKRQLSTAQGAKYSRFEADVSAMQRDSSTYCDEPEDEEDFAAWLASFDLQARRPDVDALVASNTFMAELQARIVPLIVEYDIFWTRYFYRLHKLQQKHDQIMQLTQRANQDEEEEVGWGSDEEGEGKTPRGEARGASPKSTTAARGQESPASKEAAEVPLMALRSQPNNTEEAATAIEHQEEELPTPTSPAVATSPTLSEDGTGTVSAASEVSQVSGGTPDPWTVVSSPRKGQQSEKVAAAAPEGATAPAAAAEPVAHPAMQASGATKPAEASISKAAVAASAAAVAATASGVVAAQQAPVGPVKEKVEGKEAEEGSDLSDFDAEGDDDAAGGEDAVDEDWGDDWE